MFITFSIFYKLKEMNNIRKCMKRLIIKLCLIYIICRLFYIASLLIKFGKWGEEAKVYIYNTALTLVIKIKE